MRVLLTGAAGFIGSHVLQRLLDAGHAVTAIDDLDDYYDPAVKRANLAAVRGKYQFLERDIRDAAAAFDGGRFDLIVHLAGRAGVRPSIVDPALYFDVNVIGTQRLADLARARGCPRMVFASSSSVYGSAATPFDEESTRPSPISPYGASKLSAEYLLRTYHVAFGLRATCLRFFTVYGPRQRPDMAIHKFARLISEGHDVPVFGQGDTLRDYTYVDDIVDGVMRAMETDEPFEVYNIGGAHMVPLMEMIETLARALGKPAKVRHEARHPADPERTHASVEKMKRRLGWQPRVSFAEGVKRFAEWFRSR